MSALIPAPIRYIFAPQIIEFERYQAPGSVQEPSIESTPHKRREKLSNLRRVISSKGTRFMQYFHDRKMRNQAVLRVALAVAGIYAVKVFTFNPYAFALAGCMVSLPATTIALGTCAFASALPMLVNSLFSLSFYQLGTGLALATSGWLSLEYHDVIPLGVVDLIPGRSMSS